MVGEMNAAGFIRHQPRPLDASELFGNGEASLEPVFMEARAETGAAEPGAVAALERPQLALCRHGACVDERVLVDLGMEDRAGARRPRGVERNEHLRLRIQLLKAVHP